MRWDEPTSQDLQQTQVLHGGSQAADKGTEDGALESYPATGHMGAEDTNRWANDSDTLSLAESYYTAYNASSLTIGKLVPEWVWSYPG